MYRRRGKTIAFTALGICIAILSISVLAFRDALLERWHIHRLESGDRESMLEAAGKLADSGSRRAIAALLRKAARLRADAGQDPEITPDQSPGDLETLESVLRRIVGGSLPLLSALAVDRRQEAGVRKQAEIEIDDFIRERIR